MTSDQLAILADLLAAKLTAPPRIALTKTEAAAALGISVDSLERYVLADLKLVREGRLVLIPVSELERWVRERAAPTFAETVKPLPGRNT